MSDSKKFVPGETREPGENEFAFIHDGMRYIGNTNVPSTHPPMCRCSGCCKEFGVSSGEPYMHDRFDW